MALSTRRKQTDTDGRERLAHGTMAFPCGGYAPGCKEKKELFSWHWHEELEIILVLDGQLEMRIPSVSFHLKKGDCILVNSNILHYGISTGPCQLRSLVFSPKLITGDSLSVYAVNYMMPLLSCPSFTAFPIPLPDLAAVTAWFQRAFHAYKYKEFGYEFTVREQLSHICLFLYTQFQQELADRQTAESPDHIRIRAMLEYLHTHFSENLTLADIASVAGIGERECLRCFKKTIQLSPMQYLLKYRMTMGAQMLLESPTQSISHISTCCGFDSPSNFSKMFKRFYHCSPREYRKAHTETTATCDRAHGSESESSGKSVPAESPASADGGM